MSKATPEQVQRADLAADQLIAHIKTERTDSEHGRAERDACIAELLDATWPLSWRQEREHSRHVERRFAEWEERQ